MISAVRSVAVKGGDDAGTLLGMAANQHPVLVGQRNVGLEDAIGKDELADVVQQRCNMDQLLLLARVAGPLRDRTGVARHRGAVAGGHLVAQVQVRIALSIPTWKLANCLLRRSSSSARCWESNSCPRRYWKVIKTTPKRAIADRPMT